ncbi:hypothetical protein HMPREF1982_01567 [Clostridiales bacterium oral taxon 876 str. F0540]|nr:hypothetical protein HMPREF1982_01567 [Clostridiales bacterium oral taxon 876 str. F0540]
MSILDKLFGDENTQNNGNNNNSNNTKNNNSQDSNEATLQLRKEELDINKDKVQTGEVTLSKQIVEDQQTVNVPVTHEEVVIERRPVANGKSCDAEVSSEISSDNCQTIKIPVSEEKVNVDKHTVVTEEVSAYKREIENTKEINETLRREEAKINKNGNVEVVSEDNNSSDNLQ